MTPTDPKVPSEQVPSADRREEVTRLWRESGGSIGNYYYQYGEQRNIGPNIGSSMDQLMRFVAALDAQSAKRACAEVEQAKLEAADEAVDFVFKDLAEALNVKEWHVKDGTETWEGDVSVTMWHILHVSGVLDEEDGTVYTRAEVEKMREALQAAKEFITGELVHRGKYAECAQIHFFVAANDTIHKIRGALSIELEPKPEPPYLRG